MNIFLTLCVINAALLTCGAQTIEPETQNKPEANNSSSSNSETKTKRQLFLDEFSLPPSARALANSRTADPWFLNDDGDDGSYNEAKYGSDPNVTQHSPRIHQTFVEPKPYRFAFNVRGPNGQTEQYRSEAGNGKVLTGSYGYMLPDGIYRHVDYVADERGFKAFVRTSEPGMSNNNPSNVVINSIPVLGYSNFNPPSHHFWNGTLASSVTYSAPGNVPVPLPQGPLMNNELRVSRPSWLPSTSREFDANYLSTLNHFDATLQGNQSGNTTELTTTTNPTTKSIRTTTTSTSTTEAPFQINTFKYEDARLNQPMKYSGLKSSEFLLDPIKPTNTDSSVKTRGNHEPTLNKTVNHKSPLLQLSKNSDETMQSNWLSLSKVNDEQFLERLRQTKLRHNKFTYDEPMYRSDILANLKMSYGNTPLDRGLLSHSDNEGNFFSKKQGLSNFDSNSNNIHLVEPFTKTTAPTVPDINLRTNLFSYRELLPIKNIQNISKHHGSEYEKHFQRNRLHGNKSRHGFDNENLADLSMSYAKPIRGGKMLPPYNQAIAHFDVASETKHQEPSQQQSTKQLDSLAIVEKSSTDNNDDSIKSEERLANIWQTKYKSAASGDNQQSADGAKFRSVRMSNEDELKNRRLNDWKSMQANIGLPMPPRKALNDETSIERTTKSKPKAETRKMSIHPSSFDLLRLNAKQSTANSQIELEKFKQRLKNQLNKSHSSHQNEIEANEESLRSSLSKKQLFEKLAKRKEKTNNVTRVFDEPENQGRFKVESPNSSVKYDEDEFPRNVLKVLKAKLKRNEQQSEPKNASFETSTKVISSLIDDKSSPSKYKARTGEEFINDMKKWPSLGNLTNTKSGGAKQNHDSRGTAVHNSKESSNPLVTDMGKIKHRLNSHSAELQSAPYEVKRKEEVEAAIVKLPTKPNTIDMDSVNPVTASETLTMIPTEPTTTSSGLLSLQQQHHQQQASNQTSKLPTLLKRTTTVPAATANAKYSNSDDLLALAERAAQSDRAALLNDKLVGDFGLASNHRTHAPYTLLDADTAMLTSASSSSPVVSLARRIAEKKRSLAAASNNQFYEVAARS